MSSPNAYRLLLPEALAITFNQFGESSQDAPLLLHALLNGLPEVVPVHHHGRIWEVVEDVVSRNKIDLLVVATHGRTGLGRMLQGSVAEELFRNVHCPALVLGPEVNPQPAAEFKINRVLLGTDFGPNSVAPSYAAWLARTFHSQLAVVNVRSARNQRPEEGLRAILL